ncbi:MAG: preprotein translocase subunit SecE [Oscillospiraceae bacterium]|jgi:preprotein translocase subunit SecE|nr:preprotein translocase subunit SecE [Oscillospiraceae bacterium]
MSGEKKPGLFVRMGTRLSRWFRETKSELKKVVWPTRKQLVNNTAIVVASVVLVGIVIAGLDAVFLLVIHRFLPFVVGLIGG